MFLRGDSIRSWAKYSDFAFIAMALFLLVGCSDGEIETYALNNWGEPLFYVAQDEYDYCVAASAQSLTIHTVGACFWTQEQIQQWCNPGGEGIALPQIKDWFTWGTGVPYAYMAYEWPEYIECLRIQILLDDPALVPYNEVHACAVAGYTADEDDPYSVTGIMFMDPAELGDRPGGFRHYEKDMWFWLAPTWSGYFEGIADSSNFFSWPLGNMAYSYNPTAKEFVDFATTEVSLGRSTPYGRGNIVHEFIPEADRNESCDGCPSPDTTAQMFRNLAVDALEEHGQSLQMAAETFDPEWFEGLTVGVPRDTEDPTQVFAGWAKQKIKDALSDNRGEEGSSLARETDMPMGYKVIPFLNRVDIEVGYVLILNGWPYSYGGIVLTAPHDMSLSKTIADDGSVRMTMNISEERKIAFTENVAELISIWRREPNSLISEDYGSNVRPADYYRRQDAVQSAYNFFELTPHWYVTPETPFVCVHYTDGTMRIFNFAGDEFGRTGDENEFLIRVADQTHETDGEGRGSAGMPKKFELRQNYPNPFNAATKIEFALPEDGQVKLEIYDILGQRVQTLVDEYRAAGKYSVEFDSGSLASGMYFYRLTAGDFTETKKMVLMK